MPRVESLMLTHLSRYSGPKEMVMPKITVNHPLIMARIPSKVSFASRSEDRIYVTSETPELLAGSIFKFLNQENVNYAPNYIPLEHKADYFKTATDRFLKNMEELDTERKTRFLKDENTPINFYFINLSNSLRLQFLIRPEEMPDGLNFISRAWALFQLASETRLGSSDKIESPLDKLEKDLRDFVFTMGSYNA